MMGLLSVPGITIAAIIGSIAAWVAIAIKGEPLWTGVHASSVPGFLAVAVEHRYNRIRACVSSFRACLMIWTAAARKAGKEARGTRIMTCTLITGAPGWLGSQLVRALLVGLPDVPVLSRPDDARRTSRQPISLGTCRLP